MTSWSEFASDGDSATRTSAGSLSPDPRHLRTLPRGKPSIAAAAEAAPSGSWGTTGSVFLLARQSSPAGLAKAQGECPRDEEHQGNES